MFRSIMRENFTWQIRITIEFIFLRPDLQQANGYQRKIKCEIRKKIQIYNELEIPLLIKPGFISATANCNNVTTNCNNISLENFSNSIKKEICAQNMEGISIVYIVNPLF